MIYQQIVCKKQQQPTCGLTIWWLEGSTIGRIAKPGCGPGRTSDFELQILTSTNNINW